MIPETRYAVVDGVHVAYQVLGDGPLDLVFVTSWVSHIEVQWEESHSSLRFSISWPRSVAWFCSTSAGWACRIPLWSTSVPASTSGSQTSPR